MATHFHRNKPVRVICALIERGGKVLAAKRRAGESQGGLWEFPGGKLRQGESDREALAREIGEELGVVIRVGRRLKKSLHTYGHTTIELVPFRCEIVSGTPRPKEHAALAWVDRHTARAREWSPADIAILRRFCRRAR